MTSDACGSPRHRRRRASRHPRSRPPRRRWRPDRRARPKGSAGSSSDRTSPSTHTFSRTPAFAWSPVRGAACYEFELATSRSFDGSSVDLVERRLRAGSGEALSPRLDDDARIERVDRTARTTNASSGGRRGQDGRSPRSGFRPLSVEPRRSRGSRGSRTRSTRTSAPSRRRGATPLEQAVRLQHALGEPSRPDGRQARSRPLEHRSRARPAYDVWYPDIGRSVRTHTNVADQREFYTSTSRTLVAHRAVARPAGAAGRRRHPERPARRFVRSVEPDVRDHEPRLVAPGSLSSARRSPTIRAPTTAGGGPRAHAGADVQR